MPRFQPVDDDEVMAAHYLAGAIQYGDCLCRPNRSAPVGKHYPCWTKPNGKTERMAHLILRVYSGERPKGACSLHSCDNMACINPEHLRWGTHKENTADAWCKKRLPMPPDNREWERQLVRDGKHPSARLKPKDVKEIRWQLANGETGRAIAIRFGVSCQTISNIKNGHRWGHFP